MALPRSVEESYYVSHALTSSGSESEWRQESTVDGVKVNFKLDSGATCSILPHESFAQLPKTRRCLRPGPIVRSYRSQDGLLRVLDCTQPKWFTEALYLLSTLSWLTSLSSNPF
jgi:hypothetical protein